MTYAFQVFGFLVVVAIIFVAMAAAVMLIDPAAWWHDGVHGKKHDEDDLG